MAGKRRGRPPGRKSDASRELILTTAQRLFGEGGYGGVSMERLATETGRTVRAIYHWYPSKRALFEAATDQALERFGQEVLAQVFIHDSIRDRVRGYLDMYRTLHRSDPHLVPFIGMVLVDAISNQSADSVAQAAADTGPDADTEPAAEAEPAAGPVLIRHDAAAALRSFLGLLVDDAIARHEIHPDVDREGAITLLASIGRGLSLSALGESDSFPAMLDVFQHLIDGTLFTPGPGQAGCVDQSASTNRWSSS